MEFRIEHDTDSSLRFYAEPADRTAIGGDLLSGIMAQLQAGASGSEGLATTRNEIARRTVAAFGQTQVYAWLKKCDPDKIDISGDFSRRSGLIPTPRISITFADRGLAAKFKISFAATVAAPSTGGE